MQFEFILRGILFIIVLIPVALIAVAYLETVNRLLHHFGYATAAERQNTLNNPLIKFSVLGVGLVGIFVVNYFWWGIFSYQLIMSPILGPGYPEFAIIFALISLLCFVPFFRGYYSELKKG